MPYVKRNAANKVSGVFVAAQPGFAEEFLAPDDPEVIAYNTPKVDAPGDKVERDVTRNYAMEALIERIAEKEGISKRQLIDDLRARERGKDA